MADTALIVAKNLSHNVLAHIEAAKISLIRLANVYLDTERSRGNRRRRRRPSDAICNASSPSTRTSISMTGRTSGLFL